MIYGKITSGQLEISDVPLDGYKPITYAPVPEYDQETQYVIQLQPVERDTDIYVGVDVLELPPQEDVPMDMMPV